MSRHKMASEYRRKSVFFASAHLLIIIIRITTWWLRMDGNTSEYFEAKWK